MKLSKTEQLFMTLPADVQYDIEMQLYIEFNDKAAAINDNNSGLFTSKDLTDLKRAETSRKKELVEAYLSDEWQREKVVFEFEKPSCCYTCPLLNHEYDDWWGKDMYYCKALKGYVDHVSERRWVSCPLKEVKNEID